MKHIPLKVGRWALTLIGLVACTGPVEPLASGKVISTVPQTSNTLSEEQLREINSWIDAHQSGLGMVLATPPSPSTVISLSDARGRNTAIELYSLNESWKHAVGVQIRDANGKFLYGGQMSVSSKTMNELRYIINIMPI